MSETINYGSQQQRIRPRRRYLIFVGYMAASAVVLGTLGSAAMWSMVLGYAFGSAYANFSAHERRTA